MSLPGLGAGALLSGFALAGAAQAVLGARAVARFAGGRRAACEARPAVTVLKPLHGDEPLLEAALESFFRQDYGPMQLVFGVQSAADPAIGVVERLRQRYPERDAVLVTNATPHGANGKIGNLINMLPAAKHDVLVISDSDVHVAPDYLAQVVAALQCPQTGVVTTLYSGLPAAPGLVGRLGAAQIGQVFLPGVLLARQMGRQDCLGATMALTRATLERCGGLAVLKDQLADDAVLGKLALMQGLAVRLAGTVPATTVAESRLGDLLEHELRWARTIRAVAPWGHVAALVQYPLAWALLAVVVSGAAWWSLGVLAVAWAARAWAAHTVERLLGLARCLPAVWLPLRDVLSTLVVAASFAGRRVRWRGQTLAAARLPYYLRGTARPPRAARPDLRPTAGVCGR